MRKVALALAAFLLAASTADAKVVISIDKSTQRMTVAVDGATRWTWPVSTGRRGHATPNGTLQAFRMEEDHYSKEWDDAPMPHSIFFTKRGHAIHGSYDINAARHAGLRRLRAAASRPCPAAVRAGGAARRAQRFRRDHRPGAAPSAAPAVAKQTPQQGAAGDVAAIRSAAAARPRRQAPQYQQYDIYASADRYRAASLSTAAAGYEHLPPPPPGYIMRRSRRRRRGYYYYR